MEWYNFKQNEEAHKIAIHWFCERGFASYAENLVKILVDTYYLDERCILHSSSALWEN